MVQADIRVLFLTCPSNIIIYFVWGTKSVKFTVMATLACISLVPFRCQTDVGLQSEISEIHLSILFEILYTNKVIYSTLLRFPVFRSVAAGWAGSRCGAVASAEEREFEGCGSTDSAGSVLVSICCLCARSAFFALLASIVAFRLALVCALFVAWEIRSDAVILVWNKPTLFRCPRSNRCSKMTLENLAKSCRVMKCLSVDDESIVVVVLDDFY